MSTAPSSSASPSGIAHAAQASARPGAPGQRKAGPQNAADQFANMLSLLSATADSPALPQATDAMATATAAAAATPDLAASLPSGPQAAGDATLAAMLQWAGLPQPGVAARSQSGQPDATAPLVIGTTATPATATPAATDLTALPATPLAPPQTALAATGPGPGAKVPDPMLQGMQPLTQAEAPDAQTLAALPAEVPTASATAATPAPMEATTAAANTTTATATNTATTAASRPANSGRSPTTVAGTHSLQQTHHAQAQTERLQVQGHTDMAATVRSTVALDERFASMLTVAESPQVTATGAAVMAAAASPQNGGTDLSGHAGSEGDADPQTTPSDTTPSDGEDGDAAPWADDDWAQADNSGDTFAAPTLRQASLRVGEDGEDAIDIRLSLTGQELNLGFRTDNADARAALSRHAEGGLAELLQRGGIQLGDVSVGSQSGQPAGQDAQQASGRHPPTTGSAPRGKGTGTDTDAVPGVPLRPRSDGSRPLDLFV